MSRNHRLLPVAVGLGIAILGHTGRVSAQPSSGLPTVVVLATGGTIAGAAATNVQAGYTSGQVGVSSGSKRTADTGSCVASAQARMRFRGCTRSGCG